MKFNKTLVAALLASSMLAAGAAQAKSLVYCSEGSPENFTPVDEHHGHQLRCGPSGLQPLVQFEPGTHQCGSRPRRELDRLATMARRITFKLRKGVKFHSGVNGFTPTRDLNADDVIWSFEPPVEAGTSLRKGLGRRL